MNKEELSIKDKIYEETKEFGRAQFVDEIYKLQQENKALKDSIKEAIDYIKNNTYKCQWGDLEQDNEDINISDDLTDTEFIEGILEILERTDK